MENTFAYNEPRLHFTRGGRFLVRFITFFSYAALSVIALLFLTATTNQLQAVGLLVTLFLLDRAFHSRLPSRLLSRARRSSHNIADYVRPQTYKIVEVAFERTLLHGGDFELQLFAELLKRPDIRKVFARLDISADKLMKAATTELSTSTATPAATELRAKAADLMKKAFMQAQKHYDEAVEPYDLLGALHEANDPELAKIYTLFDIKSDDLEIAFLFAKQSRRSTANFLHSRHATRHRVMNRSWTARPTPVLDRFSSDLTDQARAGAHGFLIGHASEYERLVNVLSRPVSPNALLIGEPGSGKEAIVNHLAAQMVADRVPKPLFDKRIVELSVTGLTAGAAAPEIQERVQKILAEIRAAGNVILYIPSIHSLLLTGPGSISGADVLVSAITSGELPFIGATYPQDFKKHIEQKSELSSLFESIRVSELTDPEAVKYLIFASLVIERTEGIAVSFVAIKKAVELARRYFREKLLPGSAENIISEAVSVAREQKQSIITASDVIKIAERKTNVSLHKPAAEEAKKLLNLEQVIHEQFIDQDEAVKAVSSALRQYRSGLARKGGPIASFLFVGPTGVGKTELAKILTQIQFGSKSAMVRFDMTEYQDKQSFFRLIGSPDGSSTGALTEAVREKPYSLILLDEFEKAYPDILNLFLQVLDDGRLTDNVGRTVDFQNTIIIATSNAHSTFIKEEIEKGTAPARLTELLKQRLTEYFKPELLNRFSGIIFFKSLSRANITAVTKLALAELAQTLAQEQAIEIAFDASAIEALSQLGYDPVYGARPLRGVISEKLRAPLSEKILRGELAKGTQLTVRHDNGQFIFE